MQGQGTRTGRGLGMVVAAGVAAVTMLVAVQGPREGTGSTGQASASPTRTPSPAEGLRPAARRPFPRFGQVTVSTRFALDGPGVDIDTIAFWRAPRPARSLMFVTSKGVPLVEVWHHPYGSSSARRPLTHPCLEHTEASATNGVVVDQGRDRLYVVSHTSPRVCVFSLPRLEHLRHFTSGGVYGPEPNLALLDPVRGATRLYVSDDDVVHVHSAGTGRRLGQFTPPASVETMWGDSARGVLYVPDEGGTSGVHAYHPGGRPYTHHGRSHFGGRFFDADAEGILQYACGGTGARGGGPGLIVVSDQVAATSGGNDYEVFNRRTWTHLGTIQLRRPGGGSGLVAATDGIGSTQQASARYPRGLLTAVDADTRVVGVGWHRVFRAISARIGRSFGCPARAG